MHFTKSLTEKAWLKKCFLRQSLNMFTFHIKLGDSIFFLLGLSPIVKLILYEKKNVLSLLCGKYFLIHLEIIKISKKWNYNIEILLKEDNVSPHPHTTLSCWNYIST